VWKPVATVQFRVGTGPGTDPGIWTRCYHYQSLADNNILQGDGDVGLQLSIDGTNILKERSIHSVTPILLLLLNLPLEERVIRENFILSMIIPGPKEPNDCNTFLQPLLG